MAGDLAVHNRSGKSSVMFIYSPASILETSLAGTGGSPAPIITQFSGAEEGQPSNSSFTRPMFYLC